MARPLVAGENIVVGVAERMLLDHASFQLEPGERVALVGPNGCGKSTLLDMVRGIRSPEGGSLQIAPRTRLVAFDQHPKFAKGARIKDIARIEAEAPPELKAELERLDARLADPALYEGPDADSVLARYGEVQRELAEARALGGMDVSDSPLFEELGFTEKDLDREVASLSGGERTRLFLARALAQAQEADMLVLDEPTNHLDVETLEWLEETLNTFRGGILFVAHDRAFLDHVCTRVLAFERTKLVSYPGDYSEFERVREEDRERLVRRREHEQKELERQKSVIEQFKHQKRFNGQMASRMQRLEKYRSAIDKTPDPLVEKVLLRVDFPASHKSSNDVVRIRGLGKRWDEERLLFYDLDLDIIKGDRMALVGENGAGKTTLLRMIVGREQKDVGNIEVAPGVQGAYFAQGADDLKVERSLRNEVLAARSGLEDEDVRGLLGRFGFGNAQDMDRKVASLSGGERARLSLLKTILKPSNLLILDEPTNHLDIESRHALVGALNAYKGTLLLVSHDRWFLDSVVNKVAVIARRQAKVFVGDFTEARTSAAMSTFAVEKPTEYLVKKAFKDHETGARYTVGSIVKLTPAELDAKRLYRTALSMSWMSEI